MKKIVIFFAVVIGSISSIWATENIFQEKVKNILIIQSYNTAQPWSLDQMRGIFQNLLSPQFELTIVDLDARRNFLDEERLKIYVDYFKQLYSQSDFDIILLMDNPALDFVNQHYNELPFLHNKPIIANGINYYDETFISNIPKIKIIKEDGGAAETVLQMIKLFPETKNIYVLNDYTTGVAVRKNLEKDFEKIADQTQGIHFIYNSNTSLTNIIRDINHLPDNTLILLGSYFYDSTLTYFSCDILAAMLAESVIKPTFCLIDYSLKQNIIGGKLNSGYEQGQLLGKVALDVLQQPEWTTSNCISCLKSNWYFNYNALKKYHLLDKPLPKNSIIIGEPVSFFKKNKQVLTYTLGIIIILILFISLIIYYNISLRKNVNRQTKKIKGLLNKFESFITEMPIGYVETDKNAIIRVWNKSAERIFGYAQEEVIGNSTIEMIISPDVFTQESFHINPNKQNIIKYVNFTKDGQQIDCEWYFTKFIDEFNEPYFMCMVIDVTKKEKLMQDLKYMLETNKKITLNRDRFLASSMHDLKNMLTPLLAYSELLVLQNLSQEKIRSICEQINKTATLLVEVFKEISEIGKIRSDIMECKFEPFDIHILINLIISLLEGNLRLKEINIFNQIPSDTIVYADREMISSILMNLINNAIKFTPTHGIITVSGNVINQETYEVQLKDTGIGIDLDKFNALIIDNKIFSTTGTDGEEGTGLGLILCKELIEKNNGRLRAALNADGGTSFFFTLPMIHTSNNKLSNASSNPE